MRFKIDWASLIVGRKFTVFALFYFVKLRAISKYKPPGANIWRGDLTEAFSRYLFGGLCLAGLIHGGAYFWNFMVYYENKLSRFHLDRRNLSSLIRQDTCSLSIISIYIIIYIKLGNC